MQCSGNGRSYRKTDMSCSLPMHIHTLLVDSSERQAEELQSIATDQVDDSSYGKTTRNALPYEQSESSSSIPGRARDGHPYCKMAT